LREFFNVFTSFLQRLPNHFFPFYFFSITQFSPPPHFFSLLSPLFFLITLILFLYHRISHYPNNTPDEKDTTKNVNVKISQQIASKLRYIIKDLEIMMRLSNAFALRMENGIQINFLCDKSHGPV